MALIVFGVAEKNLSLSSKHFIDSTFRLACLWMSMTYNYKMFFTRFRLLSLSFIPLLLLVSSCAPTPTPSARVELPEAADNGAGILPGFTPADGSRPLTFPMDFGAHDDFRTEWWYYTGNLQTPEGQHFGFELTIFRVGLLPPTVDLPSDSRWYSHSLYFAHFAISDIARERFYAFERYSRPGPGLAGAQADPYRVWIEDWSITEQTPGIYRLQAAQAGLSIDLTLTDEMGIVLHGEDGYSRKGEDPTNASYYYSQPRLRADGSIQVAGVRYSVNGLAWKDHEFSSGELDKNQIGWDWFSLQFEGGSALMLFQLRERKGGVSASSSGTFVAKAGDAQAVQKPDFSIAVLDRWRSPHTKALYPAGWEVRLKEPTCVLEIHPWMADQEINFTDVTYWEGAVHFDGACNGTPVGGNGYVELTGYEGSVPLP